MDRAIRLRSLWSWLPAFRVVAETQHLPSASESLRVSASSLSRTIRLLEQDVGRDLFDRVGRNLVLNAAGHELLNAVRRAMRGVDDALAELGPGRLVGNVHISVPAPFAPIYVLPALEPLRIAHPGLSPQIRSLPTPQINDALRQGVIDVAVTNAPSPVKDLAYVELSRIEHALCCGPGHPLFEAPEVGDEDVAPFPFVAPTPMPDGRVPDHWPADSPRQIGLYVAQLQVGLDACAAGNYLSVLPWPVAKRAGLRRLMRREVAVTRLFAAHRASLQAEGRTEVVISALRVTARQNDPPDKSDQSPER